MADKYTKFVSSGAGKSIAKQLGLPQPVRLRRFQAGDPLLTGPVLVLGPTGAKGVDTDADRVAQTLLSWELDVRRTAPEGGTSLHAAMAVLKELQPPPDNVYLLVDGLPTQGAGKPAKGAVTGSERLAHFRDATRKLPESTAINVILFPMEGDPAAAPEYWWLAQLTGGSFLVPSRDWP